MKMKSSICLILLVFFISGITQAQQISKETYDYAVKGYVKMKEFKGEPDIKSPDWISDNFRYEKIAEDTYKNGDDEFDYVVLKLLKFSSKYEYIYNKVDTLKVLESLHTIDSHTNKKLEQLQKNKSEEIKRLIKPNETIAEQVSLYWKKIDSLRNEYDYKSDSIAKQSALRKDSVLKASKAEITHMEITGRKKFFKSVFTGKNCPDTTGFWGRLCSFNRCHTWTETHKYHKNYIDIDDENKMFWIKKDRFEKYIKQGYIKKRYHTPIQLAYGASLSIPFKIRPATGDFNMKITPEITLGGYLGLRRRLSRYKPVYVYFPVITAGITTIGINRDNVIDESTTTQQETESDPTTNQQELNNETTTDQQEANEPEDGLVFARTGSIGLFFEFDSFQVGFVTGWDRPGGEIATDWIYKDRLWYSFNIGYNFLRREDAK